METMRELAPRVRGQLIPQFSTLRRVPEPCRQVLPLRVMKRYQCVVVGTARGILTVAITDQHNTSILNPLGKLTGCSIFPVLVNPARMRLLLQRLEGSEQRRNKAFRHSSFLYPRQVHSMVQFVTSQWEKQR
jgi:hypothetical protein